MSDFLNHFQRVGIDAAKIVDDVRPVQPYELLSLASMPREEALKIADRSAAQSRAERKMWNYRCDQCRCNNPVYQDNNLCWVCDGGCDQ